MRSIASAFNSLGRGGGKSSENASASASVASASSHSHSTHPLLPAPAPRLPKMRSMTLAAKAPKTPVDTNNPPRIRPDLTTGSSASSDGSGSLRTPDDDVSTPGAAFPKAAELERERDKKRWSMWFRRKSSSDKDSPPPDEPTFPPAAGQGRTLASASLTHVATVPPARSSAPQWRGESDSEDDAEVSDAEDGMDVYRDTVRNRALPSETILLQAKNNFRASLKNNLIPSVSHPPLVDVPASRRFPRSSGPNAQSQRMLTLETSMHIRKILSRIERSNLSAADLQSIAALGKHKVTVRKSSDRRVDDDMASFTAMRVGYYSRGLRMWASRPCFEHRYQVWMPDEDGQGVIAKQVMGVGRGLAVLDLEVSEWLEAMAGLILDDQAFEETIFPQAPPTKSVPARSAIKAAKSSPQPPPSSPTTSHSARSTPSLASPSQLRIEQGSPAAPVLSPVSSMTSLVTPPMSSSPVLVTTTSQPSSKAIASRSDSGDRGFQPKERDVYDDVPLAYAIQAKKKREEKERFLQAERDKRLKRAEEMKKLAEAEKRRQEEERRKVEEERRLRNDRRKSILAEEVVASRRRIESARLGTESYTNIREANERDRTSRAYSRPAYDSAQDQSQPPQKRVPSLPRVSKSQDNLSSRPSPSGSRPSSVVGAIKEDRRHSIVSSGHSPSRVSSDSSRPPPSTRKTLPPESSLGIGRPSSMISDSSKRMSLPRVNSAPIPVPAVPFTMNPMLPMNGIPPVPPLPPVMVPVWGMPNMGAMNGMNMGMGMNMNMNMPLLPPNAPFMMQQYPRTPTLGSSRQHSPAPDRSPRRRSTAPLPQQSIPPASRSPQPTSQSGSRSGHQRYYSGEVPKTSSIQASEAPSRTQRSASYSPRPPSPTRRHDQRNHMHSQAQAQAQRSSPNPNGPSQRYRTSDNSSNNNKHRTTVMT